MIVETRSGKVKGSDAPDLQIFRGIPFAAPPVGSRRFAAPEREAPWAGVRDAGAFGASAPQNPLVLPLPGMDVGAQDEDCLYLNVYTPAADAGQRPVLVWIHGGAFVIGSGSQSLYDASTLARRGDVVVVTINYRLGPLGFLYLADLCPDLEGAVGNLGLRDQVAALEWVRENIAGFGGDPDRVTIFGESAGGMSVASLLGAPSARGLFCGAIAQSGAAHNVHTCETATGVAARFLEELGIAPERAPGVLREIPPDKLLDMQQQMVLKLGRTQGLLPFQPISGDDFLPAPPLEAVRDGSAAGVHFMTGTTRHEWKLFGLLDPDMAKLDQAEVVRRLEAQLPGTDVAALLDVYREAHPSGSPSPADLYNAVETDRIFRIPAIRLAEAQLRHREDVYLYRFDWESPTMGGVLGACHAVELAFVFGLVGTEVADLFAGRGPDADALCAKTMEAWLAFARDGAPAHAGLPGGQWPPYDLAGRATLLLGRECGVALDPDAGPRQAWEGLL